MSLDGCIAAARAGGFSGESLATICAIAGGESGWRHDAIAKDDGGPGYPSVGFFQINTSAHYDKIPGGTVDEKVANLIRDPALQGQLAFQISGGGENWRPWTVYNTGAYRRYLDEVRAAIAGGGGAPGPSTDVSPVVQFALSQVGKPYVWGGGRGGDVSSFDCSGLTWAAYQTIGVDIGGDAWVQSTRGQDVAQPWPVNALPGDLLFFRGPVPAVSPTAGPGPEHVALYVGSGRQVDARGRDWGVVERMVPWESVTGVRRYADLGGGMPDSDGGFNIGLKVPNPFGAVDQVGRLIGFLTDPQYIIRGFMIAVGAGLVMLGVFLLASKSDVGQTAKSVAKTVATKGLA